MHKIVMTASATLFLVLFGMENSQHVPISLIIGSPTQVRLIFLLAIAAAAGFLVAYIRGLFREIRFKKEIRRMIKAHKATMVVAPGRLLEGFHE